MRIRRNSIELELKRVEHTAKRKGPASFFSQFDIGSLHPTTEAYSQKKEVLQFGNQNIDFLKEKKDIIKWTKNLYCKEHRDHRQIKKKPVNEKMLITLYD